MGPSDTEIFSVPPTHRAPTSDGGTVISYVLPGATVAIRYVNRPSGATGPQSAAWFRTLTRALFSVLFCANVGRRFGLKARARRELSQRGQRAVPDLLQVVLAGVGRQPLLLRQLDRGHLRHRRQV